MKSLSKNIDTNLRSEIICKYNRHVKSRPKIVKCFKSTNKSTMTLNRKAIKMAGKENDRESQAKKAYLKNLLSGSRMRSQKMRKKNYSLNFST